jgi:hypothetical protein
MRAARLPLGRAIGLLAGALALLALLGACATPRGCQEHARHLLAWHSQAAVWCRK